MLVVLTILGMVGAVVLARGPSRSATLEMRAASTTVAGALRLGRSRAIASNRATVVRFDVGRGAVQVGGDAMRGLPAGVAMAVVTAEGQAIEFLPDGSSSGGRVELAGFGRRTQVGVDWLTGRVSVLVAPGS